MAIKLSPLTLATFAIILAFAAFTALRDEERANVGFLRGRDAKFPSRRIDNDVRQLEDAGFGDDDSEEYEDDDVRSYSAVRPWKMHRVYSAS